MTLKKIVLFSIIVSFSTVRAQQYRIASFNIRYDNPRDSGNLWVDRSRYVTSLIRFHDFDIFGFGTTLERTAIIDHIFTTVHFAIFKWGVHTDSYHGKFPSDHFPVMTVLELKK
ncbi:MAG TPA: hypothetical protein VM012_10475 [Flavitalea sp.]|nr:hypothetical protein [Flavitalea sp.]